MTEGEIQDHIPADDETRTIEQQAHVPLTTRNLQEQPLNASIISQAAMGQRGKDIAKGRRIGSRSGEPKEERALVTTRSLDDGICQRKKKRKSSCWRSRGMLLFTVFLALLLDETLMTVIVPVLPDYFLNSCIGEKCSEIDNATAQCDSFNTPLVNDIGTTSSISRQTALDMLTNKGFQSTISNDHVIWTTTTMEGVQTHPQPIEFSGTSNVGDVLTSASQQVTIKSDFTTISGGLTDKTAILSDLTTSSPMTSFEDICMVEITPKIGILFASKFIIRIILSPFVGTMAHKIGFSILLLSGCVIMLISSLTFAFGVSYEVMLTARIIHGLGATLNEIGGLGLLAYKYRNDEKKRGFALGLAIGGFAAGTLIGPPLGGIAYDFLGKESPFLIMAGCFVALGVLELIVFNPRSKQYHIFTKGSPIYKLIMDPYILGTAGALMIASGVVALLEPTLPIWMRHNIKPTPDAWQLGAVFLPSGVSYIVSSTIMGYLGYRLGRWALSLFALVVLATSVAAVPYTNTFLELIGPMVGIGFGFGTVDSAMTAMLNSRVDAHHKGAYGGAAAISTFAFCLGFAIGPSVSGFLTNAFGFKWLMRGIAIITLIYAPICITLRRPGNNNQNTTNYNNGHASGTQNDVTDDVESIPIPSISRRLSRV